MRDTRTLNDAVGEADGWKTVRPRKVGKQAINRPADHIPGTSQIATGSNITLSQLQSQPGNQRSHGSPSRNRSVPRGRQSRLGEYWDGQKGGQGVGDDEEDIDGRQVTNILNDILC